MHKQSPAIIVPIDEVFNCEFFEVLSGEYEQKFMLYIPDSCMPGNMRIGNEDDEWLFEVVHIDLRRGNSLLVVVREINDLHASTPVLIRSPLLGFQRFPNGAKIVLQHIGEVTPDFQPTLLATIADDGEIIPTGRVD